MEYTEQQKAEFKSVFSIRRRNQIFVAIPLAIIVFSFIFISKNGADSFLGLPLNFAGPIFLILIAAALIFSFKNWRCPACNKYLGKVINPKHCHSCGIELR